MVSNAVYALCHAPDTVTSELAKDPAKLAPGKLAEKLYTKAAVKELSNGAQNGHANDLDRVAECGKFGSRPSDLFLKIYSEVLDTLDTDPLAGLVSPPLLGASGVMPLSIISVFVEE